MRLPAIVLALTLAACGGLDLGPARFPADGCRPVELEDDRTAQSVVGAEDLAFDPLANVLWVSAYDRLNDKAGGVYAINLSDLDADRVEATNLLVGSKPHGLTLREDGRGFYVINRQSPVGGVAITSWGKATNGLTPQVETLPYDGLCAANDLVEFDGALWVTLDRAQCAGSSGERVRGAKAGRLLRLAENESTEAEGLFLPNGITVVDGEVWVAEMRSQRMRSTNGAVIDLPGSPDNLTSDGALVVAAVQPSLLRFGLYRYGYTKRAPSRVVAVDPQTERIELLFEDKKGHLLPGATAAVLVNERILIASSVRGKHLLLCEVPA